MGGLAVFLGFVALVVGFGFINHKLEKRRRETLRATAAQLGLDFAETDQTGLQSGFTGFKLFAHGSGRTIRNIVYGRVDGDVEAMLFDYAYTSGSGKNKRTYSQTVAFFQSDRLLIPEFIARPEGLFDKIGQVFGYQDIDMPMHPEFSRRFILRGTDESAIRDFFRPDVVRFFENNTGLSVEAKFDRFIVYRPAKRLKPEEWGAWLAKGREAVKVFGR
jgi:hypothetical protein